MASDSATPPSGRLRACDAQLCGSVLAEHSEGGVALRFPPQSKGHPSPRALRSITTSDAAKLATRANFRPVHPAYLLSLLLALTAKSSAVETVKRPAKVHTPPIRTVQKWNPLWSFGNADDPTPPDWYRPADTRRRWRWQMRNPLHNFTHYVIGVSDRNITRTGKYPDAVFAPGGGWNWAFSRHRVAPLPFVSFEGARCRFYLGWRESGNFGGKLNFEAHDRTPPLAKPAARH